MQNIRPIYVETVYRA